MSIAVPASSVPSASAACRAPSTDASGKAVPDTSVVPAPVGALGAASASASAPGPVRGSARRPLAVALLTAALAAAPAAQAVADAAPAGRAPEGARAVLDGLKTYGQAVVRTKDGAVRQIPAGLYEMRVDGGGMLQTYGVGAAGYAQPQARYTESGWGSSPLAENGDAGRIRWVLEHSYPQLNDLAGLAKAAGAGALTAESAAAGTQVAIWRLAEGAQVEASDPAAEKLADYLQHAAGRLPEPPASLGLDPGEVSGEVSGPVGSRLGPVTVRTGAQSVSVTPDAAATAMGGARGRRRGSAADHRRERHPAVLRGPGGHARRLRLRHRPGLHQGARRPGLHQRDPRPGADRGRLQRVGDDRHREGDVAQAAGRRPGRGDRRGDRDDGRAVRARAGGARRGRRGG
ncbi:hypothetical protein GCM10020254_54560 [Streptomyces goshikiensis]